MASLDMYKATREAPNCALSAHCHSKAKAPGNAPAYPEAHYDAKIKAKREYKICVLSAGYSSKRFPDGSKRVLEHEPLNL